MSVWIGCLQQQSSLLQQRLCLLSLYHLRADSLASLLVIASMLTNTFYYLDICSPSHSWWSHSRLPASCSWWSQPHQGRSALCWIWGSRLPFAWTFLPVTSALQSHHCLSCLPRHSTPPRLLILKNKM